MAAVTDVDTYPFLIFSDLTYHLEDTGICFLVPLCYLKVRGLNLEIATKKRLHHVKIVQYRAWKVPCSYLQCVGIPRFLSAICYDTSVLNESQNLLQGLVSHGFTVYLSHFNLFLPQYQITLSHSTLKNVALPIFEVFIQFC